MKHLTGRRKRFATIMIVLIVFIVIFSTVFTFIMYLGSSNDFAQNASLNTGFDEFGTGSLTGF